MYSHAWAWSNNIGIRRIYGNRLILHFTYTIFKIIPHRLTKYISFSLTNTHNSYPCCFYSIFTILDILNREWAKREKNKRKENKILKIKHFASHRKKIITTIIIKKTTMMLKAAWTKNPIIMCRSPFDRAHNAFIFSFRSRRIKKCERACTHKHLFIPLNQTTKSNDNHKN